jgi:hypothetical protein
MNQPGLWVVLATIFVAIALPIWGTVAVIRRKVRREPVGILGWVMVIIWLGVAALVISPRKTPEQRAAEAREAERERAFDVAQQAASAAQAERKSAALSPYVIEMAVKRLLRDPDSAQFGEMHFYNNRKLDGKQVTFACGSVNAKNGFGGYTGSKAFVFVSETVTVAIQNESNNSLFVKLWNALCRGQLA